MPEDKNINDNFAAFKLLDDNFNFKVDAIKSDNIEVPDDDKDDDLPPPPDDVLNKIKKTDDKIVNTPIVDDEPEISPLKAFASHFKEKGLIDFNEEEFEDTDEGLEKIFSANIDKKANETIQQYFSTLPEDLKQMAEFLANGGKAEDYINSFYNKKSISEWDVTDEDTQKALITEHLKKLGNSDEEIEEAISDYDDSSMLSKEAIRAQKFLVKEEEKQKQALLESKKQEAANRAKEYQNYLASLKEDIDKRTDIQGFALTPTLKNKIYDHITKPVTKDGKTQLALNHEKNKDSQFLYAYLDLLDWDITKLEKQAATKAASNLRKNLSNFTDSRVKTSKGSSDITLSSELDLFKSLKI